MNSADDEAARHAFDGTAKATEEQAERMTPKLEVAKAIAMVLLPRISMKMIPCTVWSSGRKLIPKLLSNWRFSSH